MSPVIEEHARARLITDGPLTRPVPVDMRYDPADASSTIHVSFASGTDWAVGRDLLESGLRFPTERGNVRVWPCGRAQLVVELHSADGVEVFQIDNAPLIRFLHRTYEAAEPEKPTPAPTPAGATASTP